MRGELFIFSIFFALGVIALDDCGPNTISMPCGNPCEVTCGQLKPKYCSKTCKVNGCVCKLDYIRRDENGPCIPKKWCKWVAERWEWDDPRFGDEDSS